MTWLTDGCPMNRTEEYQGASLATVSSGLCYSTSENRWQTNQRKKSDDARPWKTKADSPGVAKPLPIILLFFKGPPML